MASNLRQLLAVCLFCFLAFAPAIVAAAPRPTARHPWHAKRSFFDFKWGGRLFGGDRWGDVLTPPPTEELVLDNSVADQDPLNPAVNNGNSPNTVSTTVPVVSNTRSLTTNASPPSGTPNQFGPSRPTSSTTSSVSASTETETESETETPTSTTTRTSSTPRPTSSSSSPRPTSSSSSPRPTSSSSTPRPTSSSTPRPTSSSTTAAPSQPTSGNSTVVSAADQQAYLKGHNDERAKRGAQALVWDDSLSRAAQTWANNCQFKHSGGTLGAFGENLAAGTGPFSIADGILAWNNERPDYNPSAPVASHWTQVVWKDSTKLGCARASCRGIFGADNPDLANYIVCEYFPQGNFLGRFPENVQK